MGPTGSFCVAHAMLNRVTVYKNCYSGWILLSLYQIFLSHFIFLNYFNPSSSSHESVIYKHNKIQTNSNHYSLCRLLVKVSFSLMIWQLVKMKLWWNCIFSAIPPQYYCGINIRKLYLGQASNNSITKVKELMTLIFFKWLWKW